MSSTVSNMSGAVNQQTSGMNQQQGQVEGTSRITNAQRIQQKKAIVRSWSRDRKLEKLASYSSCKIQVCYKLCYFY